MDVIEIESVEIQAYTFSWHKTYGQAFSENVDSGCIRM